MDKHTQSALTPSLPAFYRLQAQCDRELRQLRELRRMVLAFLDRRASFAELRRAVQESEVQS